MTFRQHALYSTPFSGATDIAAAKTGYRVVVYAFGIKTGGKFQSDASVDLTNTLPDGYVQASQPDFLFRAADGKKLNVTTGTGFVTWAYERVLVASN